MTIKHQATPMTWEEVKDLLITYSGYEIFGDKGRYYPNRIKQWLGYLKRQFIEADVLFNEIRTMRDSQEIVDHLSSR
jgi:tRNA-dihydrouridine synthase C